jgi:cold-inducible RNA-binding protein
MSNTKMYVGNLSWTATETDVRALFEQYGDVTDIHLPSDRETGRPRGFAFVTMGTKEAMEAAIKALDGSEWMGRPLKINEARPREERAGGGGGYGGGGGGYGGGGGGGGGRKGGGGGYGGGGGGRRDRY